MFLRQFEMFVGSQVSRYDPFAKKARGIHSNSVAAVFPFVYSHIHDKGGFRIGHSAGLPVFIDFFVRDRNRVNSNMVVIGKSGGGKSFATKMMLTNLAAENSKIFILDPENEYTALAKSLHGNWIDVGSATQGRINPFHIITALNDDESGEEENNVSYAVHLQFLEEYFKQILPGIDTDSMEFLNNIWTAISTPNETLITLLSIPLLIFIEAPLTFYLISNFFNIKFSKKQAFIYIASTVITALIANYVIAWPFNIVLNYSSAFIILFFIMKLNFIQSLIATLFPSIVFNLAVNLIANPYLDLLKINLEQSATIAIYRIPFVLLAYLIVFIFCLILKYKKITINILENFDKRTKTIITLNFIFGFLNIFLQGVLSVRYIDILPIEFTFFNFISLLFYFGLSFYSLAKIMNLVTTTQKLENEKEYNKTLHILHDSVRGFKHDFDNIVTTIGGYIKTNDMKGLEKYYSQLEEDCEKVNNLYILNPDIINNPGIYNLLTTKYSEAIEKGIKVNLTFLLDLNNLHMKIYEFARMLGILLDNAIEAASESDEKVLNIVFRNDSKNNRNIVLIENTYKDKNVNIDEIFNKGVTGKENHTGLGLWEVKQILKKNNNINLYTNKNDTYFSQQLEIYY